MNAILLISIVWCLNIGEFLYYITAAVFLVLSLLDPGGLGNFPPELLATLVLLYPQNGKIIIFFIFSPRHF